jgi:translation initiation factor 3 subunit F
VVGEVVEVLSCVPCWHQKQEDGSPAIVLQSFEFMSDLHRRAHTSEVVVGWYGTVTSNAALSLETVALTAWAGWRMEGPRVHLSVDVGLREGAGVQVRGYVPRRASEAAERVVTLDEVSVSLACGEADLVALETLVDGVKGGGEVASLPGGVDAAVDSMTKLQAMLETVGDFVDDVVAGRRPPNAALGRAIADAVSAVPRTSPEEFGRVLHDAVQDLLAVGYLATLTETQLALAEKLSLALPFS